MPPVSTKCLLASPDVALAFRNYEALRGARTARVARQARRIGAIGQWENRWIVQKVATWSRVLSLSRSPDMQLNADLCLRGLMPSISGDISVMAQEAV